MIECLSFLKKTTWYEIIKQVLEQVLEQVLINQPVDSCITQLLPIDDELYLSSNDNLEVRAIF